jgi:hypothetical protein
VFRGYGVGGLGSGSRLRTRHDAETRRRDGVKTKIKAETKAATRTETRQRQGRDTRRQDRRQDQIEGEWEGTSWGGGIV